MIDASHIPWKLAPLGKIYRLEGSYLVRVGEIISDPQMSTIYSDENLTLLAVYANSLKAPLGYILKNHHEFSSVAENPTNVTFLSGTDKHRELQYLWKDNKVHLLRFNGEENPSYWFLVRYRP